MKTAEFGSLSAGYWKHSVQNLSRIAGNGCRLARHLQRGNNVGKLPAFGSPLFVESCAKIALRYAPVATFWSRSYIPMTRKITVIN
jgi:hypothetical protein